MSKVKFFNLLVLLILGVGCSKKSDNREWNINDQEYLETAGFNVLVFHDYYPEGDQGGIAALEPGDGRRTD